MAEEKVFLQMEDEALDKLLAADQKESGLCVGRAKALNTLDRVDKREFIETSIVVIEGGAGTGKTTLALQIASKVVKKKDNWGVIFLSLEQSAESLKSVVECFNFGGTERANIFLEHADGASCQPHEVRFCRLSPLPLAEQPADATFETRFAELQHMVLKQSCIKGHNSLFVIDSLNAFTGHPLTRSQLYQLFALFRAQKIPLIVTLEQPEKINSASAPEIETACFLCDIVIRLTRESGSGYLQFFLEVSKSRVCRQGLGRHLYKTRTVKNAEETNEQERTGLVVYPSMHFMISQARIETDQSSLTESRKEYKIDEDLHKEELFDLEDPIKSPACFALQGPAGTHKLALGLNLGTSYVPDTSDPVGWKARLLVVTFGGQGEIDFKGVAWLKNQDYLRKLKRTDTGNTGLIQTENSNPAPRIGMAGKNCSGPSSTEARVSKDTLATKTEVISETVKRTKEEIVTYGIEDATNHKKAEVTVLTFQIGMLTPEECIYRVKKVLEDQEREAPFHSVLVSDTAELCTGFPLLSKDPMFFAALLDLFESKKLLTVGLGVHSSDTPALREINQVLMAKATHRMVFYQYPKVEDLMKDMVDKKRGKKDNGGEDVAPLHEQLVSVVIDNVTGKHYKREPKWIQVEENDPVTVIVNGRPESYRPKTLKFLSFDDNGIIPSTGEKAPAAELLGKGKG
jgi:KaiC/GvpD/RAD55 family RecA-like ATPase